MGIINLETKDYVLTSLDAAFNDDIVQSVCMRLNIHRGKYWADPNLGSRFYLLRRSKDVPRMLQTVRQYAEEALADLVPARVQALSVTANQTVKSRVDLNIEITRLTGEKQTIPYFVPVGG
ncbi:phage GP46 family protein [Acinetobacter gyllenbergii]|uniref:phage GP46 family protein n=1 Tax=Acinetobacter gyllenbergii TaxID=134534 RepID=UPI003AF76327